MSTNIVSKMTGPDGVEYTLMFVTPTMAEEFLTKNRRNRRLSNAAVDRYARDMKRDSWMQNGSAVCFDTTGQLLDGQHRLHAIVRSNVTVLLLVITNLPSRAQHTMDDGKKRTLSDRLGFQGEANTAAAAAIIRRIIMWKNGYKLNAGTYQPTTEESLFTLDNEPGVRPAIEAAVALRSTKILPPSIVGLAWWLFQARDVEQCAEFFEGLSNGAMMPQDHPILVLRNKLIRMNSGPGRIPESVSLALTIKAWNLFRKGRTCRDIRWSPTDAFPEPE